MESKLTILEMSYRQNGEDSSVICSEGIHYCQDKFLPENFNRFFLLISIPYSNKTFVQIKWNNIHLLSLVEFSPTLFNPCGSVISDNIQLSSEWP